MKRGICIGKFYPPHKGHQFLIEQALSQVDSLTVLVCDKKGQSIPGALRGAWLQEMVPQAKVRVIEDSLPDEDSRAWASYTLEILGYVPDVVFTSEDYGEAYSRFLGCRHVQVDRGRKNVPVSGTRIREDPLSYWDFLDPCVRAYYVKRVCLIGAESTGKTTLAKALASHFDTVWVPEFGRTYSEGKMSGPQSVPWHSKEFVFIAGKQNEMEDQFARLSNKILFCDTDSFATALWHERYLGTLSPSVGALSSERKMDLYLLTHTDCPFVQDGLRDGESIRERMHQRFIEELEKHQKPYLLLSGSLEARLKTAVDACQRLLIGQRTGF